MRRGHTSVLIRHGGWPWALTLLSTHSLRHTPPHTASQEPARSAGFFFCTAIYPTHLPPKPLSLFNSHILSPGRYCTRSWVSQEKGNYIKVNQLQWTYESKCMSRRLTHRDLHSLVSHNSTRHRGILHINWCCLVAIFTPLQPLRQMHSLISRSWLFIKLGHFKQSHRAVFFFFFFVFKRQRRQQFLFPAFEWLWLDLL